MPSPPSTPRYARPTAASISRCSPKSLKSSEPRKSLQPRSPSSKSSSTPGLMTIKPADRKRPCPLATLPTELRLLIFEYALPSGPIRLDSPLCACPKKQPNLSPSLFHVCRLIRSESAEIFLVRLPFVASISSLQPESGHYWADKLPTSHLALLARNRNMTLTIPSCLNSYFTPHASSRWHYTKDFGNIYGIGEVHQRHFLRFCRLAKWWQFCAENRVKNIGWNIEIQEARTRGFWHQQDREGQLREWLFEDVTTIALPCVQKMWVRGRREKEMKRPALQMLDGLDRSFQKLGSPKKPWGTNAEGWVSLELERSEREDEWNKRVALLRNFISRW
ncbi:hypothetical protein CC80DRAFT_492751 [Byssothecium circinans]|uniref:F-box domain-containing protein n=1 Tax=Byssothecium circinans TaxID=147558 RepID=A0A6A5TTN9_9PLEO|nr:hypothetical protein CC80DRAFT_492751 [Byssothecium circinans]